MLLGGGFRSSATYNMELFIKIVIASSCWLLIQEAARVLDSPMSKEI